MRKEHGGNEMPLVIGQARRENRIKAIDLLANLEEQMLLKVEIDIPFANTVAFMV